MSGPSPAFQFYTKEWLSSTKIMLMTPAQEGAYIRLLCHMWESPDCAIPDDDQHLSILSRLGEGWFNGGSTVVRLCFIPHPKIHGALTNERLLKERRIQAEWRAKSSKGGLKSAAVRRNKNKGGSQMVEPWLPNGTPNGTKQKATPQFAVRSSLLTTNTSGDVNGDSPKEQALLIYEAFPKKVAKGVALKRIREALKSRDFKFLLEATKAYAEAVSKWPKSEKKFVARPSRWFEEQRYDDDRQEWLRNAQESPYGDFKPRSGAEWTPREKTISNASDSTVEDAFQ